MTPFQIEDSHPDKSKLAITQATTAPPPPYHPKRVFSYPSSVSRAKGALKGPVHRALTPDTSPGRVLIRRWQMERTAAGDVVVSDPSLYCQQGLSPHSCISKFPGMHPYQEYVKATPNEVRNECLRVTQVERHAVVWYKCRGATNRK